MSEEEFRKIVKEYAEMYFTKGIDSTKIFKYVDELEKKVEHLENIIKEAIECIETDSIEINTKEYGNLTIINSDNLSNILNKGSDKE